MATEIFHAAGDAPAIPMREQERNFLPFTAAAEIQALVRMLRAQWGHEDETSFELIMRSALPRIEALTSIIMSVSGGDDDRTTEEMFEAVHFTKMEAL